MSGSQCRALLVVPAANTTMVDEIGALCPWIGELMVARVPSPAEGIAGNLSGYRANAMEAARPFVARKPDLVMFGCTAAGFYGGPVGNKATVDGLRALTGVTVVSTSDAMLEVLRHEAASRVAVVTPYSQDVNDRLIVYLEGEGIQVTVLDSFLCATSAELLAVTEAEVLEKARATKLDGAQALFLACSQMPSLGIIGELRAHAGLPVWSSVSATAWAAGRAWQAMTRRAA